MYLTRECGYKRKSTGHCSEHKFNVVVQQVALTVKWVDILYVSPPWLKECAFKKNLCSSVQTVVTVQVAGNVPC